MPFTPASPASPWISGIGDALSTAGQLAQTLAQSKLQQQQQAIENALKQAEIDRQNRHDDLLDQETQLRIQALNGAEADRQANAKTAAARAQQAADQAAYGDIAAQVHALPAGQVVGPDLAALIHQSTYGPTRALQSQLQPTPGSGVPVHTGFGSFALPTLQTRTPTVAEAALARYQAAERAKPGSGDPLDFVVGTGKPISDVTGPQRAPVEDFTGTGPGGVQNFRLVPPTPGSTVHRPPPAALDRPPTAAEAGAAVTAQGLTDIDTQARAMEAKGGITPAGVMNALGNKSSSIFSPSTWGTTPSAQEVAYANLIKQFAAQVGKAPAEVAGYFDGTPASAAARKIYIQKATAQAGKAAPPAGRGGGAGAFDPSKLIFPGSGGQ